MRKRISGIYKIQSILNPLKIYIGSSISIKSRINEHLSDLRRNDHPNKKLQNHFNKYGEKDLVFSIVKECESKELITNEQYFIDSYKPFFNICPKAGHCGGLVKTLETRTKLSMALKGRKFTDIHRRRIGESNKGYQKALGLKWTKERREKTLASMIGRKRKPFSEETKRHMSESHKGHKHSPETKELIIKSLLGNKYNLGKKASDETKKKRSDALKGRIKTKEHIIKIHETRAKNYKRENHFMYGKKHSEETKLKISKSLRLNRANKVA